MSAVVVPAAKLTSARFYKLDGEIEAGVATIAETFVTIGEALAEIRDQQLYKVAEFSSFRSYCRERFDLGKSQAYRLIEAAAVARRVSPMGDSSDVVPNERQARELARLPPEQQEDAWSDAVALAGNERVTVKHVSGAVKAMLPPKDAETSDDLDATAVVNKALRGIDTALGQCPEIETVDVLVNALRAKLHHLEGLRAAAGGPSLATVPQAGAGDLERLAEQRNSDPEFKTFRAMQRAVGQAIPSRAQRITDFVLDGGELALLRLGLDWTTVTPETAKAAYRAAILKAHPDHGGSRIAFEAAHSAYTLIKEMLGVPS